MRLKQSFTADAWEEYIEWQESDRKGLRRLNRLIEEARRTPNAAARRGGGEAQARSAANAATLRSSRLNSTPTKWIGCPRRRYLSA